MPDDIPFVYWDSCVPLSYINGIEERVQHIDPLMRRSGETFQIVTSVITITEVAFAKFEQDQKLLDQGIEVKIGKLWQPGAPIKLVEVYELIALRARGLMRAALEKGWSLKPADALHLATADQLKCKEFHTYDERLEKFAELTDNKFPITPPISNEPHLPLAPGATASVSDDKQVSEPAPVSGRDGSEQQVAKEEGEEGLAAKTE